ncbi:hypothetical protein NQ317_011694 [Molorchus minor]|uniref:HTH psq-type domain-containing protein n=1 Tax=Molorchus minor TaxID=1323400 RepID=A0ABQ9JSQ1_9CUCU|nr:hypothetical protein NQ317_011694 [Molorchus minor]
MAAACDVLGQSNKRPLIFVSFTNILLTIFQSKINVRRTLPKPEAVTAAFEKVLNNGFTLRQSTSEYWVSRSTLSRHLKKHGISGQTNFQYIASNFVKQTCEEAELNIYSKECANMHYGFSTIEVRKLVYNYAKSNHIKFPESGNRNEKADVDLPKFFLKRNKDLNLCKVQKTSLARSTAFNKTNVRLNRIIYVSFSSILAPKGNKQLGEIGSMISGEGRTGFR